MIFSLIMLAVSLIGFVCSIIFVRDDPDVNLIFAIFFLVIAICFTGALIICPADSMETKNIVSRMRVEPQNFSILDASEMNTELARIDTWKNTIFTYYKGFDTTPLDLTKFVEI